MIGIDGKRKGREGEETVKKSEILKEITCRKNLSG